MISDQPALSPTPQQFNYTPQSLGNDAATGKNTIVSTSWFLWPRSRSSPKIRVQSNRARRKLDSKNKREVVGTYPATASNQVVTSSINRSRI